MSCSGIFLRLADHELTPEQFWEVEREGEDELRLVKVKWEKKEGGRQPQVMAACSHSASTSKEHEQRVRNLKRNARNALA